MDPKVNKDPITFSHLIDLGKCCVSKLPKDRPEMKIVCQTLDQLASSAAQGRHIFLVLSKHQCNDWLKL